jgi:predicted RNA-binding protein with PIN domain
VEVVFASAGHAADGILRERIRHARDPRGLTVVTSDQRIVVAAEARGVQVVSSDEFAARLGVPKPASVGRDVALSAEEVEEWLRVFRGGKRK